MNDLTLFDQLLAAKAPVLLALAINFLLLFLKAAIPARLVSGLPILAMLLGAILYPALESDGDLVRRVVIGACAGGMAVALHQAFKQLVKKVSGTEDTGTFLRLFGVALVALMFIGCSTFKTVQTDMNYEDGKPLRQIVTRTTARTFWDSKSSLASFHASQTDKTQSAKVGSLNQESSGTNTVQLLQALAGLVGALPK